MKRTPLSNRTDDRHLDHADLGRVVALLQQGQYLRRMPVSALRQVLRTGELVEITAGEMLIRQGDSNCEEVYLLLQGCLVVEDGGKFILRLQEPGDIAGEMAVLTGGPRSADVRAESDSQLVAFPASLLTVPDDATQAHLFYYMLSHILATKLHMTTLQSRLRKDERVSLASELIVALVFPEPVQREELRLCLQDILPRCDIREFDSHRVLLDELPRVDLLVVDIWDGQEPDRDRKSAEERIVALSKMNAPMLVISDFCNDPAQAASLYEWGVEEALPGSWYGPDLRRALSRLETWRKTRRQMDRFEQAADTDDLTGLANRRRLTEFLKVLEESNRQDPRPFALMMVDVDHFKHYNDRNGHQAGDEVLRQVAAILRQSVRAGDLTARYGGEEFVVVLPDSTAQAAYNVAEKLRAAIASQPFAQGQFQPGGKLTITVGVAGYPDHGGDSRTLLKRADESLYEGKAAGRNCVVSASGLISQS